MENQDWEKLGEDISRTVQEAIDSQNYNRLNQTITNTISGAMDTLEKSLHNVGDVMDKTARTFQYRSRPRGSGWTAGNAYRYQETEEQRAKYGRGAYQGQDAYRGAGGQGQDAQQGSTGYQGQSTYQGGTGYQGQSTYQGSTAYQGQNAQQQAGGAFQGGQNAGTRSAGAGYRSAQTWNGQAEGANALVKNSGLFIRPTGIKAGGIVMTAFGYIFGISLLFILLALLAAMGVTSGAVPVEVILLTIIVGVLGAGGCVLAGVGTSLLGRIKRYQRYLQVLGDKDYCEISYLAEYVKKPNKFIVKDLEKMIRKGWFRQGHLDSQKTCLIASNKAFEQYHELMQRVEAQKLEEKQMQEKKAQEQKKEQKNLDPEVQEIIRTGDEYIKKIHECNDAIPGEEISAKISRMEMLIDRIFDRVEQNPESISDIRRLMEYYLPTTVKLLEAYEQLDSLPVQGENIITSKNEIEKTLDTLNVAFEKLLDSLFQDTAWDVASDISVLNTMLAQEGLTKDDF